MLKSMNFTVLTCIECGATIKLEPQQPFDAEVHMCPKKAPITNKVQDAPTKTAPKVAKKPTKK